MWSYQFFKILYVNFQFLKFSFELSSRLLTPSLLLEIYWILDILINH